MNFAGGVLGWSEAEFWGSSLAYFRAAHEGYRLAKGGKPKTEPMSRERYEEIKRKYATA
jgi:hypothetical protein